MVKWTEDTKLQMFMVILEHLNPTSLPWEKIANAMGPDFSTEAVRQQYKTIKKGFKTPTTSSSTPQAAKAKTSASKAKATSASTTSGAAKGRKRKAAEISNVEDDDEDTLMAPESSNVKTESSGTGLSAEVFKAEPIGDEAIDLENEALYSAA